MKSSSINFIRGGILAILFFVIDEGINILYEKITGQTLGMGIPQLIIGLISLLLTYLCNKTTAYASQNKINI